MKTYCSWCGEERGGGARHDLCDTPLQAVTDARIEATLDAAAVVRDELAGCALHTRAS